MTAWSSNGGKLAAGLAGSFGGATAAAPRPVGHKEAFGREHRLAWESEDVMAGTRSFDQRLVEASREEQRWRMQSHSPTPERSLSPSRRSWTAKESSASEQVWSCGGRGGCGYRRNRGSTCAVCAQHWGHWQVQSNGSKPYRTGSPLRATSQVKGHLASWPTLGNSFQALEQRPPWKKNTRGWEREQPPRGPGKGMGGGKGQGTKGLGPKAEEEGELAAMVQSPSAEDIDMVVVDLGKLRQAYAAVSAAMGPEAEMAEALLGQIQEEEARRSACVLPHVQMLRTQRRLQQLNHKAEQALKELNELEEQKKMLCCKIEEVQARGRSFEEQIAEAEATKTAVIEKMAEQQGVQWVRQEPEVGTDPTAARILGMLALAATHTDAGDETAKSLGMHLLAALACLEAHLQAYDSKAAGALQGPNPVTPRASSSQEGDKQGPAREGSRSPRRTEDAAAASLLAAAKALAASKPTGGP